MFKSPRKRQTNHFVLILKISSSRSKESCISLLRNLERVKGIKIPLIYRKFPKEKKENCNDPTSSDSYSESNISNCNTTNERNNLVSVKVKPARTSVKMFMILKRFEQRNKIIFEKQSPNEQSHL